MIAANALGYGTNRITNWYSDVEEGRALLGLAPHERVVGFVHIGSYTGPAPERPRPEVTVLTRSIRDGGRGKTMFYEMSNGHGGAGQGLTQTGSV